LEVTILREGAPFEHFGALQSEEAIQI